MRGKSPFQPLALPAVREGRQLVDPQDRAIFGLAVAGERPRRSPRRRVGLGILLGLVVGAPVGGVLLAWAAVRTTPARMPEGLDWPALGGVAPLKGIGFTVAIFISVLAFEDPDLQGEAKLAILVASMIAGAIGLAVLLLRHAAAQRRAESTRP